jgi:hypothetical protein
MARNIIVPATAATEDIVSLTEYPGKMVRFHVGLVAGDGTILNPNSVEMFELTGDNFAALMSGNPAWAPRKPANTYRNEDLWYFVDKLRSIKNA